MKYYLMTLIVFIALLLSSCGEPSNAVISIPSTPTRNPFIAVEQAERTAAAAQNEADFYSRQLTATAEAPIIAITSTAAAFAMQQQFSQATQNAQMATETAALTSTAMSWSPTPNATATMVAIQISAEGTMMANQLEMNNLKVERERTMNTVKAMSWYVVGLALLFVALMFGIGQAKKQSVFVIPSDERGNPQPIFLDGVVMDVDRMPNGMGSMDKSYLKRLPAITAERQDMVTNRDQLIDMHSRRARLPKRLLDTQTVNQLPEPNNIVDDESLFPLPAWDAVKSWKPNKDSMPLGTSKSGMEYWDLQHHPHLAVFGKTRSGKDRRCLRPLVTFMLASGQRVILIGKETDFLPFIGHPNAVFVPVYDITEREEAMKYAKALTVCVEEKNRRIHYMAKNRMSLWQDERTFIVLDELGNALLEMDNDLADISLRKARSMVNEAGKAGMSLVFSAQRPKGFVDLTTQCGRVVFQVETDQERGYALGIKSADRLPDIPTGYFYRKFGVLQVTGGFEPSDEDIRAFLGAVRPNALPKLDWIDGVVRAENQTDHKFDARSLSAESVNSDEENLIIDKYVDGKSSSAIVREIWGVTGGDVWRKKKAYVDSVVENYEKGTTTTSNTPILSPNPA